MYYWRKLTEKQRREVFEYRRLQKLPWHRPPHIKYDGSQTFIFSAACFDHEPVIGISPQRLAEFEKMVIEICVSACEELWAWCILPNHYHLLFRTDLITKLKKEIGLLHGRTSRIWNLEDGKPGRKVWYNYFERPMKSNRHFWASLNYVNNNSVHHGYVEKWSDWPFSSAVKYLAEMGHEEATRIWQEYPILDYGKGWDEF
jgi:putative transposase